MMQIHVARENIDTTIEISPYHKPVKRRFRSPDSRDAEHARVLVFDARLRPELLLRSDNLAELLKDADPDVDINSAGQYIARTFRVVVDADLKPVYTYKVYDVLTRPDGSKQERPHKPVLSNADEPIPVRITDKLMDPMDIATRYVISRSYYLTHTDGVSYKFLFEIASALSAEGKFARMQAYDPLSKKPAPLVLHEGAKPYPGAFLEGRVQGEEYCLVLHLSDQELKLPDARGKSTEEGMS